MPGEGPGYDTAKSVNLHVIVSRHEESSTVVSWDAMAERSFRNANGDLEARCVKMIT